MPTTIRGTDILFNDNSVQSTAGVTASSPAAAKAWVCFNGVGTVSAFANFNVSSITDNGNGDYTINFLNALTDSNYAVAFGGLGSNLGNISGGMVVIAGASNSANTKTTTQLRIQTGSSATGSLSDNGNINVVIFR